MEPLRVHIAELVIATDPASADVTIADSISERAEAKGLAVVAREVVGDVEALIRAQLERFIADPNVDVVIATGVTESVAASDALRPLVTTPVPGFTDLFRWLAYQEIGATAMLSNAEAAQCSSTIVFVLPAVAGAVRAAMDKLILPQLDPATLPKNLVQQIPRLAPLVIAAREAVSVPNVVDVAKTEAVPQQIESEKTESGPGIAARAPATGPVMRPADRRAAGKTGPHVLRKESPSQSGSDVTKQIDRSELERNLKHSESHDAITQPAIDLRKLLPKLPPGADDGDDHDVGDSTDITAIEPPKPLARARVATREPQPPPRRKPATIQIPPREDKSGERPARNNAEGGAKLDDKSAPIKVGENRTPPALTRKTPPRGEVVSLIDLAKSADELDTDPSTAPIPERAPTPAPIAAPERRVPARVPTEVSELDAAELEPATDEDFAKAAAASEAPKPRARPATNPPPPPKKRAPTEPPPLLVPDKKPRSGRASSPTVPPVPLAASNDLPRGKFVYPEKKSPAKTVAKFLGFALIAAAAGVAFVHFFLAKPDDRKIAAFADAPGVAAPIDAAQLAVAEPDAEIPEIEIDVSDGRVGSGSAHSHTNNGHMPVPAHVTGSGLGSDRARDLEGSGSADVAAVGSGAGSGSGVVASTIPPEDPTCDEVACVLEKYARPCCARYKPADTEFHPTVPGQVEALDKSMVKAGIEGVKPRVIACGEQFAAKGTVKISMAVTPEGTVKDASVADSPDPGLGKCVAQALRAASFAKTAKGGQFVYPFVF